MTRPPPIRLVVLVHNPGSDAERASQLIEHLRRDWFQPELWLLYDPSEPPPERQAVGVEVVHLSNSNSVLIALTRLAWRLWRKQPDICTRLVPLPMSGGDSSARCSVFRSWPDTVELAPCGYEPL